MFSLFRRRRIAAPQWFADHHGRKASYEEDANDQQKTVGTEAAN